MFTGIVEEVGTVRQVRHGPHSAVLTIGAETVLDGTKIGDSIAVNGICLTVTALGRSSFSADVMHETLNRAAPARFMQGSHVNLERAMPADGRFGGHIVTGHVDGVGRIVRVRRDDTAVWYMIKANREVLNRIVEKGSVTVDGVSLTVAAVSDADFSISAIPHTVRRTVLRECAEGSLVNLETDIIGKYVEKLIHPAAGRPDGSCITREFLSRYGF